MHKRRRGEKAPLTIPKSEPEVAVIEAPAVERFPLVGIGASAGGLEAFSRLLAKVPAQTGMAYIFILHLDPTHHSMLPELLGKKSQIPVTQVQDGMRVEPDHAYVIPPNTEMSLLDGHLMLRPRKEAVNTRAPIDHFFRTLASVRGSQSIGVVLSGNGADGTMGLAAIKGEGGITFAQAPESARHDDMPLSAIASGCVDLVLSPEDIAGQLVGISRHAFIRPESGAEIRPQTDVVEQVALRRIVEALHPDADFSEYRMGTLARRAMRRMAIHRVDSLETYAERLETDPEERRALADDLLIHVTRFFRDPNAFEALTRNVFPGIVANRKEGSPIKIWSLACSSGEEVYSIGMALHEFLSERNLTIPVQIFGTDISEAQIVKARAGRYSENITLDVSPERLQRFFEKEDGSYRVRPLLRQMCVFAQHDVTRDAPFRALDLICCRNLLIYFEPVLQNRLLPMFHHALNTTGMLMLGSSEGIGASGDLFAVRDAKHRIFSKKDVPSRRHFHPRAPRTSTRGTVHVEPSRRPATAPGVLSVQRRADEFLLRRFAPPGLVIDADFEILHLRGDTSPYLMLNTGVASLNLFRMAREGLQAGLRAAIQQARAERKTIRREGLWVRSDQGLRQIKIEVVPLAAYPSDEGHALVLFEEMPPAAPIESRAIASDGAQTDRGAIRDSQSPGARELEVELAAARTYLESIIADREASNQELQSANEEISSTNEELQSFNEELETAKEELQSSTEELATLNDELRHRNDDLNSLNDDLVNLLNGVAAPIIVVDLDLRVRRISIGTREGNPPEGPPVGQRLRHLSIPFDLESHEDMIRSVIDTGEAREEMLQDRSGRRYSMRVQKYLTSHGVIDGAVIVLVDVEELEFAREKLRDIASHLRLAIDSGELGEWEFDVQSKVMTGSPQCSQILGLDENAPDRSPAPFLSMTHPEDRDLVAETLDRALESSGTLDVHCRVVWPDSTVHWIWACGSVVPERLGQPKRLVGVVKDITSQQALEDTLRLSEARLRELGNSLEIRVEQRTMELQASNDQLVSFSYTVAHDLRAPIRAMRGYADAILADFGEQIGMTGRQYGLNIVQASARLDSLIEDLLTYSRTGSVVLNQEPVELEAVVRHALETIAADGPLAAEVTLECPKETPRVMAHETTLCQVVTNLVSNAIKFVKLDATPRIRIHSEPRDGFVRLWVDDEGIGIAEEHHERVFGVFERLHPRNRYVGNGIGLAFVKRAVTRMGGGCGVESSLGKGSRFWIDLPTSIAS